MANKDAGNFSLMSVIDIKQEIKEEPIDEEIVEVPAGEVTKMQAVKMELKEDNKESGKFTMVLVPEDWKAKDVKPMKCSRCSSLIEEVTASDNGVCALCRNANTINVMKYSSHYSQPVLSALPATAVSIGPSGTKQDLIPFRCHYCSETYEKQEEFYRHIRIHATKKRHQYVCGMCGKNFKQTIQYKRHICARNIYRCNLCPKQFESVFRLESHLLLQNKFKCRGCSMAFCSKKGLEMHMCMFRYDEYKCTKCNEIFESKDDRDKHLANCLKPQSYPVLVPKMEI